MLDRPFGADRCRLAGFEMPAGHGPVLGFNVNQVWIKRVDPANKAIAAADVLPILIDWSGGAFEADAWPAPAAVVLQAAVNPVRPFVAHGHVIKLAQRKVIKMVPMCGSIVADIDPAIAADEHVPAIARVDPQSVTIGVDSLAGVGFEGLAAISRAVLSDAQNVDVVLILGIDANDAEIHGSGIEAVDAGPGFAAVAGPEDAAVLEAIRPLLVLNIFLLPAQMTLMRTALFGSGGLLFCPWTLAEHDLNILVVFVPLDF